jgi:glycosyltransferase involved in cell wall biosynthesis
MMLSVIIPTRNRCESLDRLFNALSRQTLKSDYYEIILIDNGSSDNTQNIFRKWNNTFTHISYYYQSSPGLHIGRHKGLHEAKGNVLVYIDDDIEPFETWLEAIQTSFENKEIVLVGGKCLPKYETPPPQWISKLWEPDTNGNRIFGYLSLIDLGDDIIYTSPYNIFGCNFSIRKSNLLEIGGFHPDAMPQELIRFRGDGETYVSNVIQSKGYKTLYNPRASVYHWVPKKRMTIEYFCQRAYNQGISDSYTKIRHLHGLDILPCPSDNPALPRSFYAHFYQWIKHKYLQEIPNILGHLIKRMILQSKQEGINNGSYIKDDPYANLHQQIARSYQAGYAYHQDEVQKSPELLSWVLRSEYWDCQLQQPQIINNEGEKV